MSRTRLLSLGIDSHTLNTLRLKLDRTRLAAQGRFPHRASCQCRPPRATFFLSARRCYRTSVGPKIVLRVRFIASIRPLSASALYRKRKEIAFRSSCLFFFFTRRARAKEPRRVSLARSEVRIFDSKPFVGQRGVARRAKSLMALSGQLNSLGTRYRGIQVSRPKES